MVGKDEEGNKVTFNYSNGTLTIPDGYAGNFTLSIDYDQTTGKYINDNVIDVVSFDIEKQNGTTESGDATYEAVSEIDGMTAVGADDTIKVVTGTKNVTTKTVTVSTEAYTLEEGKTLPEKTTQTTTDQATGATTTTVVEYKAKTVEGGTTGYEKVTTVTVVYDEDTQPSLTADQDVNLRTYLLNSAPVKEALAKGAFGNYNNVGTDEVKFYAVNENKDLFMAVYGDNAEFLGFFALDNGKATQSSDEPKETTTTNTDGSVVTTTTVSYSTTTPVTALTVTKSGLSVTDEVKTLTGRADSSVEYKKYTITFVDTDDQGMRPPPQRTRWASSSAATASPRVCLPS